MLYMGVSVICTSNGDDCILIVERLTFCQDFPCLLLRDALDLLQYPTGGIGNRLDGVEASINNQLDVTLGKSGNTLGSTVSSFHTRLFHFRKLSVPLEQKVVLGRQDLACRYRLPYWRTHRTPRCSTS